MAAALFSVIYSPDPLHSFSHGTKSIAMKRVSARMGDILILNSKLNCRCKYFLGQLQELVFNFKRKKSISLELVNHGSFCTQELPYIRSTLEQFKIHAVLDLF